MSRKILFIVNPISGTIQKIRVVEKIHRFFNHSHVSYQIRHTEYAGHATKIAAEAVNNHFDTVVAIGGDGTVNEIGAALSHTSTALGIIPLGSGNGLARHLQIPFSLENALKTILEGKKIKIDTCYLGENAFFCTSGTGFDALVSYRFSKDAKGRGLINYARIAMKTYLDYQPQTYQLNIDGSIISTQAMMITVANAAQFGNNAYISPEADITDGFLDVCIVQAFPKWQGASIFAASFMKTIHQNKFVKIYKAKKVSILPINAQAHAHIDGDYVQNSKVPFEYSINNKSLHVLVDKI
jgi:YegS/Rv2252/BmrU family lipid kinase